MQQSEYMAMMQGDDGTLGSTELIAAYEQGIDDLRTAVAGMTKEQVRAVIDRNFPENGQFKRPVVAEDDDVLMFTLDLDSDAYDAAIINVEFIGGKVSSAEFLAD